MSRRRNRRPPTLGPLDIQNQVPNYPRAYNPDPPAANLPVSSAEAAGAGSDAGTSTNNANPKLET